MIKIDVSSRKKANLGALKNIVSSVEEILNEASHVAVYTFNAKIKKWERLEIEGSAFITRSSSEPKLMLIVLNKKAPNDFTLDLSTVLQFNIDGDLIMLRCSTSSSPIVLGVWIHDKIERERTFDIIKKIASNDLDFYKNLQQSGESDKKTKRLLSILKSNNSPHDHNEKTINTSNKSEKLISVLTSKDRSSVSIEDKETKPSLNAVEKTSKLLAAIDINRNNQDLMTDEDIAISIKKRNQLKQQNQTESKTTNNSSDLLKSKILIKKAIDPKEEKTNILKSFLKKSSSEDKSRDEILPDRQTQLSAELQLPESRSKDNKKPILLSPSELENFF